VHKIQHKASSEILQFSLNQDDSRKKKEERERERERGSEFRKE
jgi:hypothetical protein